MDWKQHYGRYCRDCEYWEGIHSRCERGQNFEGIQGMCHRFPPSHFHPATGLWEKPITKDSDGCGEFKRVWYVQPKEQTESQPVEERSTPEVATKESESLLIRAKQVATLMGISVGGFYAMRSCGRIPMPVRLGGSVRWNKQEILDWIEADCPPMNRWKYQKQDRPKKPRK